VVKDPQHQVSKIASLVRTEYLEVVDRSSAETADYGARNEKRQAAETLGGCLTFGMRKIDLEWEWLKVVETEHSWNCCSHSLATGFVEGSVGLKK
jgi:hypothetical protein